METGDRKKLRKLMEELAFVEGNIFINRAYSPNNPQNTLDNQNKSGAKAPKNRMVPWIIGTAATLLLFPPAALFTGYKAYKANKAYKKRLEDWNRDQDARNDLVKTVSMQEKRREELLRELRKLCGENPALDGDYWWKDTKVNPVLVDTVESLLQGATPSPREWQFGLFNHLWMVEDGSHIYLQDMLSYGVNINAKDALESIKPADFRILYKNDDLLNAKTEGFRLMHLYAYQIHPIEEVVKSTDRIYVDKESERAAYQTKLDKKEIFWNGISTNKFFTDAEMLDTHRISSGEYVNRSTIRGMYEREFEAKLAKMGDYEQRSTYGKIFRGLSRITLYNCADVLISLEPQTNGYCAAILVPNTKQKDTELLVRSVQKDNPLVGRLERYGYMPEFEELDTGGVPSIQMAVDTLLSNPDVIKLIHLKNRDVLEEKPRNMDKYEYAYLIWNDNPLRRAGK